MIPSRWLGLPGLEDLKSEEEVLRPLGYMRAGDEFTDTRQGIVGVFLEGAGPRLELLCPLDGRDVLDLWLAGRAKMYHVAFEVQELATALV